MYVKYVAEQLGLDGSYIPRTYIEQIQLEKLVNDVMVCLFLSLCRFDLLAPLIIEFLCRHCQTI